MAEANDLKIYEVQADQQGNWVVDVKDYLAPGPHTVTAQDEDGNEHQVTMYVTQEISQEGTLIPTGGLEPELVESQVTEIPAVLLFIPVVLFALAGIMGFAIIRLARHIRLGRAETKPKKYTLAALIFSVIALLVFLAAGLYFYFQLRPADYAPLKQEAAYPTVKVQGQILSPLTKEGAAGVSLVSGNTTVKTSESGYYIFNSVDTDYGIKLTHPELYRALVIVPSGREAEQRINLFFEKQMLNFLIRLIDSEAMGKFNEVYAVLDDKIKEKVSLTDFVAGVSTIYQPSNVTDQQIFILKTSEIDNYSSEKYDLSYGKVIAIEVLANSKNDTYYLYPGSNGWKLIK